MKSTKKTTAADAPRELSIPRPAWLDNWMETPPETSYSLSMDYEGENLQDIPMTRAEFIALKKHLAALRDQAKRAA
jgi:hypothetical protein